MFLEYSFSQAHTIVHESCRFYQAPVGCRLCRASSKSMLARLTLDHACCLLCSRVSDAGFNSFCTA